MNTASQEHEDELKYLDLHEADELPAAFRSLPRRVPFGWTDLFGLSVVIFAMLLVLAAIGLGFREEWRFLVRCFS